MEPISLVEGLNKCLSQAASGWAEAPDDSGLTHSLPHTLFVGGRLYFPQHFWWIRNIHSLVFLGALAALSSAYGLPGATDAKTAGSCRVECSGAGGGTDWACSVRCEAGGGGGGGGMGRLEKRRRKRGRRLGLGDSLEAPPERFAGHHPSLSGLRGDTEVLYIALKKEELRKMEGKSSWRLFRLVEYGSWSEEKTLCLWRLLDGAGILFFF